MQIQSKRLKKTQWGLKTGGVFGESDPSSGVAMWCPYLSSDVVGLYLFQTVEVADVSERVDSYHSGPRIGVVTAQCKTLAETGQHWKRVSI